MISLMLLGATALAQDGLPEGEFYGTDRFILQSTTSANLDAEGTDLAQGPALSHRLRLGLRYPVRTFELDTEWDLLTGQIYGDTWDIDGDLDERHRQELAAWTTAGHYARKLSLRGPVYGVDTEIGLVTSHWGLGMVANDGAHDPTFGRNDFGDRVLRARATTVPFHGLVPLYLTVAADRVVADDFARWSREQAAWQGVFSALWRRDVTAGVYMVRRRQVEKLEDRLTRVWVFDAYADGHVDVGGWDLRLAAEAATILGRTDRTLVYGDPDPMKVRSAGATALARLTGPQGNGWFLLRAGWASTDRNPDDNLSNDFTFDRDFDVGMVLFDEVTGGIEAATSAQLTDPGNVGKPPDGIEALTTEGAFRKGSFLQPSVGWRPVEWFELRAGITVAWTPAPYTQPFYTTRAGGEPTNHHNQPASAGRLGTEFDGRAQLWGRPRELAGQSYRLNGGVQVGVLYLGPALAGAGPDSISQGMGWVELTF
jgi:hypothetical protein